MKTRALTRFIRFVKIHVWKCNPHRGSLSCLRVYAVRKRGLASIKSLVYTRVHTPTCVRALLSIPDFSKRISYSPTRHHAFIGNVSNDFSQISEIPERARGKPFREMRIKISSLSYRDLSFTSIYVNTVSVFNSFFIVIVNEETSLILDKFY